MDAPLARVVRVTALGLYLRLRDGRPERHRRYLERHQCPPVQSGEGGSKGTESYEAHGRRRCGG